MCWWTDAAGMVSQVITVPPALTSVRRTLVKTMRLVLGVTGELFVGTVFIRAVTSLFNLVTK
jgi:hypothetical protein